MAGSISEWPVILPEVLFAVDTLLLETEHVSPLSTGVARRETESIGIRFNRHISEDSDSEMGVPIKVRQQGLGHSDPITTLGA